MICTIYKKHVVHGATSMPLVEAVEQYFGGDWAALVPELAWPPLEELLDGAPSLSRAALRERLITLAALEATARLNAIDEESASDEELYELALDEVELEPQDLAALDAHLGKWLFAQAVNVYGEELARRLTN